MLCRELVCLAKLKKCGSVYPSKAGGGNLDRLPPTGLHRSTSEGSQLASGPVCILQGPLRRYWFGYTHITEVKDLLPRRGDHGIEKEENRTTKGRQGKGTMRAHKETAPILRISKPLPYIAFGLDPEQVSLRVSLFRSAGRDWTGRMD